MKKEYIQDNSEDCDISLDIKQTFKNEHYYEIFECDEFDILVSLCYYTRFKNIEEKCFILHQNDHFFETKTNRYTDDSESCYMKISRTLKLLSKVSSIRTKQNCLRKTTRETSITHFEDSMIRRHYFSEKTIEHIYEIIR